MNFLGGKRQVSIISDTDVCSFFPSCLN